MFSFDRETAILAAVVVCVAASLYMYNELRQSKDDITKIKTFLDRVQEEAHEVQMPQMVYAPVSEEMPEPEPESEPEPEPESVVVQEPPKAKRTTRGKSPVNISSE